MGSSSKKSSSKAATPAQPDATTYGPGGEATQYFSNPAQVPTTGGFVVPQAQPGSGMLQGAGVNWYTPPTVNNSRNVLASTMNGSYQDNYGRGARGMSGAYGNSSRSGRSNDR